MAGDGTFREDLGASVVVALVALPLCVGVAVASGVPAELGIVTGVVGGLVTGWFRGSSLQVSGPAAGLTVLVYEAVRTYGVAALGVLVLAAGLLQLAMGALRLGRWFRAISVAVVQGMLAGIGLVLIAGQLYAVAGVGAPGPTLEKFGGLARLLVEADWAGIALGAATVLVMAGWRKLPEPVQVVPGRSSRSRRRPGPPCCCGCRWRRSRSPGCWTPYRCRAGTGSPYWAPPGPWGPSSPSR